MRTIFSPRPSDVDRMSAAELQQHFLLRDLFVPGEIRLVHTNLDRLLAAGIVPDKELDLPALPELGTGYFTERREAGVINIGDPGIITVGDRDYEMKRLECLYIGIEEPRISFRSCPGGQSVFYLLSAPAHRKLPTCHAGDTEATAHEIGNEGAASRRRLVQYIHENGIQSCQLVMGYTEMGKGSVWNTLPPHTHTRRCEIYFYFDLGDNIVMHFLGEPSATRHVVVRDREAALSPSWSIHMGAGTGQYRFIWGMAGENRSFEDMDPVSLASLDKLRI